MMKVNPAWIKDMKEEIDKLGDAQMQVPGSDAIFTPKIISYNPGAQWLIAYLAKKGYTPKVEQLGAGVKRISIIGKCCPTCGKEA